MTSRLQLHNRPLFFGDGGSIFLTSLGRSRNMQWWIQGGDAPPLELWGKGQGGHKLAFFFCQNSLKTRLKYIKITSKVVSIYKKNSGSDPYIIFIEGGQGGQKILRASRANLKKSKKTEINSERATTIYQIQMFCPPPVEKSCIRAWFGKSRGIDFFPNTVDLTDIDEKSQNQN